LTAIELNNQHIMKGGKMRKNWYKLTIALVAILLLIGVFSAQAAMVPADGQLGPLANGDSAGFAEVGIDQGTFIETEFEFEYVGTGAIYIAAAATRFPDIDSGPPYFFGIDDFRFTVGTFNNPIWDSEVISEDIVGRIITVQELTDAGISADTTLFITMLGEAAGDFSNSYSGDVAVVPIPSAVLLLGGGLIGLVGLRRRYKK
jgi:hypothetical protein